MDLASFNTAPDDEVTTALRSCNAAGPFAPAVASGRPYPSVDALVDRAGEVSRSLPWDAVAQALAAHPRIGDRVPGDSAEASSSRREQASMTGAGDDVRAAILAGNRDYEARFDHVFLVRAAGRSPEDMLAELRRRLAHTRDQERPEVVEQLAQITELRVRTLVAS
ncbi:2-oxo-4-hydroxy-4-carboxy-5-ureidoimidazoline decarboxylase [Klenkia sp. PcliD-1-E]|uniref:2-oxo-4-hydroxy-4-carboxy-5-ureidoimidazoline decarboxylase n=1 Tax=Klenkia sp. PcliD-1-E TaxID=2954492 RepID=UPI0020978819|nr:2-oxo-4-hydroxy-4-carboxy-5-ureidoimidazoline decarboxylase [Klenkia sp. PcliD-1-E]MCO7219465.1 2-oxo-4-hydroxy-4-carboxy-5-ureidoimidazoline decarboxylase [Klenkia sp. PcliD-1-E]